MSLDTIVTRLKKIIQDISSNPELYDVNKLVKAMDKFENAVIDSLKFPDNIQELLKELEHLHLRTLKARVKRLNIDVRGKKKKEIISEVGMYLVKNRNKFQELRDFLLGDLKIRKKKTANESLKEWIKLPPDKLRKHLQSLTVREIRKVARSFLSSKELRKKKKDLIETIIFRLQEVKAQMRYGPS
ncbi:MAG: hypothetical protein ACTSUJ_05395 [Candidatus Njordarchaeales archaeon]